MNNVHSWTLYWNKYCCRVFLCIQSIHIHLIEPVVCPRNKRTDHFGTKVHSTHRIIAKVFLFFCFSCYIFRQNATRRSHTHTRHSRSLSFLQTKFALEVDFIAFALYHHHVCKVCLCNKATKCLVPCTHMLEQQPDQKEEKKKISSTHAHTRCSETTLLEQMTHLSRVKDFCTLTATISPIGQHIIMCRCARCTARQKHKTEIEPVWRRTERILSSVQMRSGVEILKFEWRSASECNISHNRNQNQSDNVQVQCWYYPVVNGVNYVFVPFNVFSTKLIFDFHCWCRLQSDWIGFRNSHHI